MTRPRASARLVDRCDVFRTGGYPMLRLDLAFFRLIVRVPRAWFLEREGEIRFVILQPAFPSRPPLQPSLALHGGCRVCACRPVLRYRTCGTIACPFLGVDRRPAPDPARCPPSDSPCRDRGPACPGRPDVDCRRDRHRGACPCRCDAAASRWQTPCRRQSHLVTFPFRVPPAFPGSVLPFSGAHLRLASDLPFAGG